MADKGNYFQRKRWLIAAFIVVWVSIIITQVAAQQGEKDNTPAQQNTPTNVNGQTATPNTQPTTNKTPTQTTPPTQTTLKPANEPSAVDTTIGTPETNPAEAGGAVEGEVTPTTASDAELAGPR